MKHARVGIALALLIVFVHGPGTGSVLARGLPPSAVRQRVEQIAATRKARVKIRMHDGRKLRGRIVQVGPESFTVWTKRGRQYELTYASVRKVKRP